MIDHWREERFFTANDFDLDIYESMLPENHRLCQLVDLIDFEAFRPIVEEAYSAKGQPTAYAMIAFKLEVLKYFYNLSDRETVGRSITDVAFRWFLKLPRSKLSLDHTLMTRFRARLGPDRYEKLFQQLIAQARKAGLVRDQLRLKDATHILANISIPSTMALLSQIRERLLTLIEKFDAEAARGFRVSVEAIRTRTKDSGEAIQMNERMELLTDIVGFASDQLSHPDRKLIDPLRTKLEESVELARKILDQKAQAKAKREVRSIVDADALRGKHGAFYDGYMLDVCMDADSELITAINVLPAGSNEAQGAIELIAKERAAHGNSPKELSIDGAGNDGPALRSLESETGQNIQVYVPPKKPRSDVAIDSTQFEIIEMEDGKPKVRCPQGELSHYRQEDGDGVMFRFAKSTCEKCPLNSQCCNTNSKSPFGRSIRKSDYQPEYDRITKRSKTERYQVVRRIHPTIERKLNECVNHHNGRRTRYRGIQKVFMGMIGIAMAVNMKRIIKLNQSSSPSSPAIISMA